MAQFEIYYDRYDNVGQAKIGQSSIVVEAENEADARHIFVKMLPINGEWFLKIDFVLESDVWNKDTTNGTTNL